MQTLIVSIKNSPTLWMLNDERPDPTTGDSTALEVIASQLSHDGKLDENIGEEIDGSDSDWNVQIDMEKKTVHLRHWLYFSSGVAGYDEAMSFNAFYMLVWLLKVDRVAQFQREMADSEHDSNLQDEHDEAMHGLINWGDDENEDDDK